MNYKKYNQIYDKSFSEIVNNSSFHITDIVKKWNEGETLLFLWVNLTKHIQEKIYEEANNLSIHEEAFFPHEIGSIHITIKNFGVISKETKKSVIEKIDNCLTNVITQETEQNTTLSEDIVIQGMNFFPTGVFFHIFDMNKKLNILHKQLITHFGEQTFEGSDYLPHVSIGRIGNVKSNSILFKKIKEKQDHFIDSFNIKKIQLVESKGFGTKSLKILKSYA